MTDEQMKTILRECAGEDEDVNLDGDIGGRSFGELGYDSLARLEVTGRIKREYGLDLIEEITDESTPDDVVALVNSRVPA